MLIGEKLSLLRSEMKKNGIDAYIIPSSDPHQSEYVADNWKVREWISDFTGSAGTVVITMDHAGLWTDSRYFLQGEQELSNSEFVLHKMYNQFAPQHVEWINENLSTGASVGIDGLQFSKKQERSYSKLLAKKNISLKTISGLLDQVWLDRPPSPEDLIFDHKVSFAGKSRGEKISELRSKMSDYSADYHLITTLDDIAWLLNIRSNDVEFNPVAIAYVLVEPQQVVLFVDPKKVSEEFKAELSKSSVSISPYDGVVAYLNNLSENSSILVDSGSCNISLFNAINSKTKSEAAMPSRLLKAVKNEQEIAHLKHVMVKDGLALAHAFHWLEKNINDTKITEFDFSEKLAECRSQQADYYGESFAAIVGYKGNGAIIHYRPMEDTAATIKPEGILLVDSGGQYQDGTTDITRTIALSTPSEEEKDAYTRVLKGHIALAKAQFPVGTNGGQLDILARQPLWDAGLNYLHGTGHGVGFFLNVHEAPQGFTAGLSSRSNTVIVEGMYTSNEPGYYKTDAYGIRIENLVITVPADHENFLKYDTITLYPIDQTLIEKSMMTADEISWLDGYHELVYNELSPHLDDEMKEWMKKLCKPLN